MNSCCKFRAQRTTKSLFKRHLFWTIICHLILNSIINGLTASAYNAFSSAGTNTDIQNLSNSMCSVPELLTVYDSVFWLLIFTNIQSIYLLIHLIANICHLCRKANNCCSPFCLPYPDTPRDCKRCWKKRDKEDSCTDYCQVFDPCAFFFVWFKLGLDLIMLIIALALFGPVNTVNKFYSNDSPMTTTVNGKAVSVGTSRNAACDLYPVSKSVRVNFTNITRPNVYTIATLELIYLIIILFFVFWGCCLIVQRRRRKIQNKLNILQTFKLGSDDSSSSDEESERYQGRHRKQGGAVEMNQNGAYIPTMYAIQMPAQPYGGQVQAPQPGYPQQGYAQAQPYPPAYPQQAYPQQGYVQQGYAANGYQNGKGMMVQNNGYQR